jgi:hypothetical protein
MNHHETPVGAPGSRPKRACDACHANKTRCDGGDHDKRNTPCSLCVRRNITCTYTLAKPSAGADSQLANQVLLGSLNLTGFSLPVCDTVAGDGGNRMQSWVALAGMKTLRDAITPSAASPLPANLREVNIQTEVRTWFTSCCESYFAHLHHHWPVVHAPTFNEESDPLALSAVVIILGCWLQEVPDDAKELAVQVHGLLVKSHIQDIVRHFLSPLLPYPTPYITYPRPCSAH